MKTYICSMVVVLIWSNPAKGRVSVTLFASKRVFTQTKGLLSSRRHIINRIYPMPSGFSNLLVIVLRHICS